MSARWWLSRYFAQCRIECLPLQTWHSVQSFHPSLLLPLDAFTFPECVTEVAVVVQLRGLLVVHPDPLGRGAVVCLCRKRSGVPVCKLTGVESGVVAGDHHPTRQRLQDRKQLAVLLLGVLVLVATVLAAASVHEVRGVSVDKLRAREAVRAKIENRIRTDGCDVPVLCLPPCGNDVRIHVDADVPCGRTLVLHDSPAAEVRFDVHAMGRHEVDELVIHAGACFAARVRGHGSSIAIPGDGVKRVPPADIARADDAAGSIVVCDDAGPPASRPTSPELTMPDRASSEMAMGSAVPLAHFT